MKKIEFLLIVAGVLLVVHTSMAIAGVRIAETYPVSNPTADSTPSFTLYIEGLFNDGTADFGGKCDGYFDETVGAIEDTNGDNRIFSANTSMPDGVYDDCTVKITNETSSDFDMISLTAFEVNAEDGWGDASQLPEKEDDFFWDALANMNTPFDGTCDNVVEDEMENQGIPTDGDYANKSCDAIGNLVAMESAMEADGLDSNLFDFADWHHMQGLYFENQFGRIEFSNEIDFMSYEFMTFLETIRTRFDMRNSARIGLDADIVNGLRNAGATITMYNVPDFEEVEIFVDGKKDTEGVVSGLIYDRVNHRITFNVAHFTTFDAGEKDREESNDEEKARRAKVDRMRVERVMTKTGKDRIMVTIYGRKFAKDVEVKLGTKHATKVTRKSKNKIVAYFNPKKMKNVASPVYVKVINDGADSARSAKKVDWRDLVLKTSAK